MTRTLLALELLVGLAVPASAVAEPNHAEERAAKQQCKVERGASKATREAFRSRYGSRESCILKKTAEEHAENKAANKNAAKECKAERDDPLFEQHHGKTFQDFYGTNENLENAYGKCVSSKAKARQDETDAEDEKAAEEFKNAAKECAAERGGMGRKAFAAEYGNNHNGRKAFGRCVSKKARGSDD